MSSACLPLDFGSGLCIMRFMTPPRSTHRKHDFTITLDVTYRHDNPAVWAIHAKGCCDIIDGVWFDGVGLGPFDVALVADQLTTVLATLDERMCAEQH